MEDFFMNDEWGKEMDKEIGQRVQGMRLKCRMSLEHFSILVGVSPNYLDLIERGERTLSVLHLIKLSTLFQEPQEYITLGYSNMSLLKKLVKKMVGF